MCSCPVLHKSACVIISSQLCSPVALSCVRGKSKRLAWLALPVISVNVLHKEESVHPLRPLLHGITLAALLLPVAFGTQASAQKGAHLMLQDLLAVEPIGESALSPDGQTIALARSRQIILLPAQGGWQVPLTSTQRIRVQLSRAYCYRRPGFIRSGFVIHQSKALRQTKGVGQNVCVLVS